MCYASVPVTEEHRVTVVWSEIEPEVEQFARIADHLAHPLDGLRAVAKHLLKSSQFGFAKTFSNVHHGFRPVHQ